MSVRCIWKKVFESIDLVNEDPMWVDMIHPLRFCTEQKGEKWLICSLWFSWDIQLLLPLDFSWTEIYTIGPQILRPLNSNWITPLTFLVLQLAENRSWDFFDLHNHINKFHIKSPFISVYHLLSIYHLFLVLFLWRTWNNTMIRM